MTLPENRSSVTLSLSSLREVAERKGFRVRVDTEVEGKSGVKHPVDLIAECQGQTILMELRKSPTPIDETHVLSLYVKCLDTSSKAVLVAMPALTSKAAKLADLYRIKVVEGRGFLEVVSKVKKALDDLR